MNVNNVKAVKSNRPDEWERKLFSAHSTRSFIFKELSMNDEKLLAMIFDDILQYY